VLGQDLGVLSGKVTGQRVLPSDDAPKVETSFEVSGDFGGVASRIIGTYWSTVRSNGSLYGECPQQGLLVTADGDIGTWTGAGVGRFTGQGAAVSFRGAIYFAVAPQQLTHLSSTAIIYEWDIYSDNNATAKFWEWK
jgi:hypothetical protein